MLTVAKVSSGIAGTDAQYLEGKATPAELGDYYLKDGERVEAPGRWVAGAETFGLDSDQPVSGDVLRTLMDVRRPGTREPLRRVGGTGTAVAAIDATFSAPKSVSAIWALGSPELRAAVELAHELAVDRAVAYAVQQVKMVRERIDPVRVEHRHAMSVIATSGRHTTARAVGENAPDPQLHSHVLLHAAVRRDGEVVAIDSRSWFVHRREVGAAYRTELAYELSKLGFEIERGTGRGGRYFEIDGVPQTLLDRWSSRHHEVRAAIEQRLAASGRTSLAPGEDRWMSRSTRSANVLRTHGDLDRAWSRTAATVGIDARDIETIRTGRRLEPASADSLRTGLTEFDATFSDREARAVALDIGRRANP
jgi:conjugative relaxase-like TrwC/TraI family protein